MALPKATHYPIPWGDIDYESDEREKVVRYNVSTIDTINNILEDADFIDQYGPLKYIGSGTNGIAYYNHHHDFVIKITSDKSEYEQASLIVSSKKLADYMPLIYETNKIDDDKLSNKSKHLYLVVMEKLIELDLEEKKIVNFISLRNFHDLAPLNSTELQEQRIALFREWDLREKSIQPEKFNITYDRLYSLINSVHPKFLNDIHEYNIGKREGGTFVIMDLGRIASLSLNIRF